MLNKKAFTLIELLVVVLIIGILAAVALPQYQKAVEKSRAMQGLTMLKSMYASVESYKLANNTYPTSFEQLDLQLPWTGNVHITGTDSRSNEDWSIELYANARYEGLIITRLSGPYVGGQFAIWDKHEDTRVPLHTITCNENLTGGTYVVSTEGLFCKKLFNGKYIIGGSGGRVYTFQE